MFKYHNCISCYFIITFPYFITLSVHFYFINLILSFFGKYEVYINNKMILVYPVRIKL